MPRRSGGGGGGGRRPSAAPPRPSPQQARSSSTAAHPPQGKAAPQQQQQQGGGSGLFGQMASTAAGVAVGSSIGHALGGMFGGGSSQAVEAQPQDSTYAISGQQQQGSGACDMDARNFTSCMTEHNGNMQVCSWYLEQLKACQQASSQY